jgi:uncharacterized membrane protein YidH (DUF202 family)
MSATNPSTPQPQNSVAEFARFILPLTIIPGITLAVTFAWRDAIQELVKRQVRRRMINQEKVPDPVSVHVQTAVVLTVISAVIFFLLVRSGFLSPKNLNGIL